MINLLLAIMLVVPCGYCPPPTVLVVERQYVNNRAGRRAIKSIEGR